MKHATALMTTVFMALAAAADSADRGSGRNSGSGSERGARIDNSGPGNARDRVERRDERVVERRERDRDLRRDGDDRDCERIETRERVERDGLRQETRVKRRIECADEREELRTEARRR